MESEQAGCGDVRLNRRLGMLLGALGEAPGVSIPQACGGGHAEVAAAYRFFDNPAATPQNILAAHVQQSLQRMRAQDTVLLVQDTTEMDMSQPRRRIAGAGPLDGSPRQGALVHLMHAFTLEGLPLGSVWHKIWTRKAQGEGRGRKARPSRSARQSTPMAQKESLRWIEGLEAAQGMAAAQPEVRLICVADSEADIYEYLGHLPSSGPVHWIVRACQDRALLDCEAGHLWEACRQAPALWSKGLQVRGREPKLACDKRARRQPRVDRTITVQARALEQVRLRAPHRKGLQLAEVTLNAVLVSEVSPPEGEVAVEWLLLTSLPVHNGAQVQQIVQAYSKRFMIETLFRVLKSGCRIEQRRFESAARHLSHLAVALIIAWRVLWLAQLGQHQPEMDGAHLFSAHEWQAAWAVTHRGQALPTQAPSAGQIIKMVAQLGGWIQRSAKSPSPPGVQTLWQGLRRLHDLSTAWEICRS
jgi:transposase-like protein/transposase Tn5 family protein